MFKISLIIPGAKTVKSQSFRVFIALQNQQAQLHITENFKVSIQSKNTDVMVEVRKERKCFGGINVFSAQVIKKLYVYIHTYKLGQNMVLSVKPRCWNVNNNNMHNNK